ncbi:MAG: hypothetical protein E7333_00245 [Clostridiales bacterium]|nr:hypothetical protein [Clostridiales bacterium]
MKKLERLEQAASDALALAPVLEAIEQGKRFSDLTEAQQEIYTSQYWNFGGREAYANFLVEFAPLGVGDGLDTPLRKRMFFKTEEEFRQHIKKTAAELEEMFREFREEEQD